MRTSAMKAIAICIFCLDILVGSILIISDLPSKESVYGNQDSLNTISTKYSGPLPAVASR